MLAMEALYRGLEHSMLPFVQREMNWASASDRADLQKLLDWFWALLWYGPCCRQMDTTAPGHLESALPDVAVRVIKSAAQEGQESGQAVHVWYRVRLQPLLWSGSSGESTSFEIIPGRILASDFKDQESLKERFRLLYGEHMRMCSLDNLAQGAYFEDHASGSSCHLTGHLGRVFNRLSEEAQNEIETIVATPSRIDGWLSVKRILEDARVPGTEIEVGPLRINRRKKRHMAGYPCRVTFSSKPDFEALDGLHDSRCERLFEPDRFSLPDPFPGKDLLTAKDLADYLGCKPRNIRKHAHLGRLTRNVAGKYPKDKKLREFLYGRDN